MKNEDLLGVPYRWHGKLPDALDCWQLCQEIRQRCGLKTPDFEWVYSECSEESFDRLRILRWMAKHGKRVESPMAGAVTFGDGEAGQPCLITSDGDRAWLIGPNRRVCAVDFWDLGDKVWRI